jgi:glycosyltransferase involved in cell wall biosynthesis
MRKPTLTIGIPAYNEEHSIGVLLRSLFNQKTTNYSLTKIIVVLDASTDNTYEVLKKIKKTHPKLQIIVRAKRSGKAHALNVIYHKANADYLLTIDADLSFNSSLAITKMIQKLEKNKKFNLTSTRHAPRMPKSWMGKFAAYSFLILENTTRQINNGNNFYSVMGMEMMPKRFYKSFVFPAGTLSDQCFVYAMATKKDKNAFSLVKDEFIYFMPVQTFHDWRVLSVRSTKGDKDDVVSRFGPDILRSYTIPQDVYIKSILKFFLRSPFYTIGAIFMEVFIRVFPYRKQIVKNGIWETTVSSKQLSKL